MEKGKKGAGPGKNEHQVMEVVGEVMGPGIFIDLPVFQDQRAGIRSSGPPDKG